MDESVKQLLDEANPQVRVLAQSARARIREIVPDAEETVMEGYNALKYSFGGDMKRQFAALVLHSEHVNLQFFHGAALADPEALLEGTGKKMRHVKLRGAETVQRKAVADLIESAAARVRA